jgi:hypothetical protein
VGSIKSDLIEFDLTRENCFICGKPATSVEHVIPKWLQRKYNLWNETIEIPNLTTITYKQLVVPACKKCNNEVYGKLEEKIKNNTADEKDIWRWANKIHFGLRLKDSFLDFDRKTPGTKIGEVFKSTDYLEQSRHFLHCITGDFTCHPDPFGSVFKFEFTEEKPFNLIHIINSSAIYICVGQQVYIVFITDGQILKKDVTPFNEAYRQIISRKYEIGDTLFFYAQAIYYMEQYTYSNPVAFSGKGITKLGRATLRNEKPLDKPLFRAICNRFGITWIDEEELNEKK